MLPTDCEGVVAAAEGGGGGVGEEEEEEEEDEVDAGGGVAAPARQSTGQEGSEASQENQLGLGVQEWSDGSKYEGEFSRGLKHGRGTYSWRNGEYYEGSFYKDYKHGDGFYYWPTGHKFTGKFYLNRKEGFGLQVFPDGSTFQGLYRTDQRFGPGVASYPDGRQDVGLWVQERLLQICSSVEGSFSLNTFPGYAAYLDPSVTTGALTQVDLDYDLLSDDTYILPAGIERYSTDGDHLPLPPGRRRELDRLFYGELWEPDSNPYQGYKREPLSSLPLGPRMQAHIHNHRLQAENVAWDVADVLSLRRRSLGPKGPLEVSSELLIQHASCGDLQAVSKVLCSGLVHPDVADSSGHTALIAATINCHKEVIHLLLDMAADIDKLNCEGMSALAVCHILYYPFHCLDTTLTGPPAKATTLEASSSCGNSPQLNQDSSAINGRPQTSDTAKGIYSSQGHLSDRTSKESAEHIRDDGSQVSIDGEVISERSFERDEPQTPAESGHSQEDERLRKDGGRTSCEKTNGDKEEKSGSSNEESKEVENQSESGCDQTSENVESEVEAVEREFTMDDMQDGHVESGESRADESRCENVEERGEGASGVERSIEVFDGHIVLGRVQWRDGRAQQGKDKVRTTSQVFNSAQSVSSYNIHVTEEMMQRAAEALSQTGVHGRCDTQGTVRKMAAMKIEHRVRLNTLKLLLERGADPNVARVPMPVLFLAIMAADIEAVRRLLLCGARTDIPLPPQKKGLYPLHVAAALPGPAGPKITEMLLHAITDPDARACDQDDIYEQDRVSMEASEPSDTSKVPHLKEGGRTALHVACQRSSDYQNASEVVALLLSHRASTDLLWSRHSPLSLAIASGNDLAVEVLLSGGADPNIPLGDSVGNALCALANINYCFGGNRLKLLEMLAKAGANFLMPVKIGDVVGTAVDYAYHSFQQDVTIANTPFHALNMREREVYKARKQLLSMMAYYLRQAAAQKERESLERERDLTSDSSNHENIPEQVKKQRKPLFNFCYYCGRSVALQLTACSRCHKVFYCSKDCRLTAWDKQHKKECVGVTDDTQKSAALKSPKVPGPFIAAQKPKAAPRPLSTMFKPRRVAEPLSKPEKSLEYQINLKENYSFN